MKRIGNAMSRFYEIILLDFEYKNQYMDLICALLLLLLFYLNTELMLSYRID